MDVPADGNCLFYACISKLQNCSTFTIELASNMRNYLMDYLLFHASGPSVSSNLDSLTWSDLVMHHVSEIQTESRQSPFPDMLLFLLLHTMLITWDLLMWIDASMQTHQNYVWSLAVTPWILQFFRLTLAALSIMLWIKNLMVIQTTLKKYCQFAIKWHSLSTHHHQRSTLFCYQWHTDQLSFFQWWMLQNGCFDCHGSVIPGWFCNWSNWGWGVVIHNWRINFKLILLGVQWWFKFFDFFGVNISRAVQLHLGGFLWKCIRWSFCCPCNYSGGNQRSHYQWFGFSLWVEVTHYFLFSVLSLSPLLSYPSFFVILEARCSDCWGKQYATHDPTYTLQFTTISSSNISKKHSPLQLI